MFDKRLFSLTPQIGWLVAAKVLSLWVSLLTDIAFAFILVGFTGNLFLQLGWHSHGQSSVQALWRTVDGTLSSLSGAQSDPAPLGAYVVVFVLVVLLKYIATRCGQYFGTRASEQSKVALRGKLYQKMLDLGPSYAQQVRTSDVVQSAGEGIDQIQSFFELFLPQLFFAVLAPLTLFVALAPISVPAALVLLVCSPMIIVVLGLVSMTAARIFGKYWTSYTDLGATFLDNLQGLETLKIFDADAVAGEKMDKESERFRISTMKVLQIELQSLAAMDLVAYGGAAAGMGVAIWQFTTGRIDLSAAVVIVLLAVSFFLPLRQLGSYFHVAMNGMTSSKRIFALLDAPVPERGQAEMPHDAHDVAVAFTHVEFAYTNSGIDAGKSTGRPRRGETGNDVKQSDTVPVVALRDVNFEAKPHSLTAIVGSSGSGKSTAVDLLAGSIYGYDGSIKLTFDSASSTSCAPGTVEIKALSSAASANTITLVSAQSHLFPATLRDNLLMANPQASESQLWQALEDAHIDQFVRSHADGLDLRIDQDARNLSGGQRQRIAIARALLRDSPIYVFDEATSSVDAESERMIVTTIRRLAQSKTVLMVTHRLADAVEADQIVVFRQGEVVERGTHSELLGVHGQYARLYEGQNSIERTVYGDDAASLHAQVPAEDELAEQLPDLATEPAHSSVHSSVHSSMGASQSGTAASLSSSGSSPDAKPMGSFAVIRRLLGQVGPLAPFMVAACCFGVIGHLAGTFLPVFAVCALLAAVGQPVWGISLGVAAAAMVLCALLRGVARYGEQFMNHNLAFRLLALFRSKAFSALRKLAPSKLDGKGSGDLVSLITTDVEKLEIFFAHTISPVVIAVITSVVYTIMLATLRLEFALVLIVAHLLVGVLLPKLFSMAVSGVGGRLRRDAAALDNVMLDDMRGLDEIIRFGRSNERLEGILTRSRGLWHEQNRLSRRNGIFNGLGGVAVTGSTIVVASLALLLVAGGGLSAGSALVAVVLLSSSFGPTLALNSLPASLTQTFASARRLFALLDEQPAVCEEGTERPTYTGMAMESVSFSYDSAPQSLVMSDWHMDVPSSGVLGIQGPSGRGKSTMLKLLMRYWDPQGGEVRLSGVPLPRVESSHRRKVQTMMSQETYLFDGTIAENLRVANALASDEQLYEALRQASVSDLVESLPDGLNTRVGELGGRLSEGERQRIGLARMFLTDADLMLFDEPTSRLDTLNEAVILGSIRAFATEQGKAMVLVSHRPSAMLIADRVVRL